MRVRCVIVLAALTACERGPVVEAPEPTAVADVDSLPTLPASIIDAPITYDLTPVLAELEKAVPKSFGSLTNRIPHPTNKRVHFAFEAKREPFKIALDGDTVRMTGIISYAGKAWYNPPIGPDVSASCGANGDRPRARIEIVTPMRLTPDWKLRSRTAVRVVEPFTDTERDQCEVTVLKIDVTEKVIEAARGMLTRNTRTIDAKVATIDLRAKFEEWWDIIQRPINLTDSVWLVIAPKGVQVEPVSGKRKLLSTGVGLLAEPRIVVGNKPAVTDLPLPRNVAASGGSEGFHILIEGVLEYGLASSLLTQELRGQKVTKGGRTITVERARMFGLGAGRIALEVDFGGSTRGRIYFVGTPHYDYAGDRLYVPDLEYDVGTTHLLVRGFAWLKHDDLRNYLRNKARWPVGGLIRQGEAQLVKGLNQELSPGVRLSGNVGEVEVVGVRAGRDAVRVRAHADGKVRLDVR